MLLKKWEQVYNELQKRAEPLAYSPPLQLGSGTSQVFEFKVRREPVLLLAFRDLARKEDYKVANRLWAEGLDLVLERYDQLAEQGKPAPRAAAIVIDNKSDTFIVVMMDELLSLYRQKGWSRYCRNSRQHMGPRSRGRRLAHRAHSYLRSAAGLEMIVRPLAPANVR